VSLIGSTCTALPRTHHQLVYLLRRSSSLSAAPALVAVASSATAPAAAATAAAAPAAGPLRLMLVREAGAYTRSRWSST